VSLVDVERLRAIAEVEFAAIVVEAFSPGLNALRVILTDGSFVDVWFSLKLQGPALPRCCYFLVTLCLSQGEEIL